MLGAQTDSLPEPLNAEVERFFSINLQWFTAIITAGQQQLRLKTMPAGEMALRFMVTLEGVVVVDQQRPRPAKGG